MSQMLHKNEPHARPTGFTLVEVLIVVGIIAVLAGLVLYTGHSVTESTRRSRAEMQVRLLADAIMRHADAWPAPTMEIEFPLSGERRVVKIAEKGWPNWNWALQFPFGLPPGTWAQPPPQLPTWVLGEYKLFGPNAEGDMEPEIQALEVANEVLAYCLTRTQNGGPFLKETELAGIDLHDRKTLIYPYPWDDRENPVYHLRRRDIVDPWPALRKGIGGADRVGNQLIRYFWVYRTNVPNHPTGWAAVVNPANGQASRNYQGVFTRPDGTVLMNPPMAEGVVVESAGPDRRFGNIWWDTQARENEADAKDNIWVVVE